MRCRLGSAHVVVVLTLLSALVLVMPVGVPSSRANGAGTGTVSGSVYLPDGTPAPYANVSVYGSAPGSSYGTVATAGSYSIADIPPGDYTLQAGYWDGMVEYSLSVPVTITDGLQLHIDLTLKRLAVLSGTVRTWEGLPVPGLTVRLSNVDGQYATTASDTDGRYEFTNMMPGLWSLSVVTSESSYYVPTDPEWLTVGYPDITHDLVVSLTGHLSGTVTSSKSGVPIGDVYVVITMPDGTGVTSGVVRPDGTYTVYQLPPTSYVVQFVTPYPNRHIGEYYNDAKRRAMATPVMVTGGHTTSGIDAVLTYRGPSPKS